MSVFSSTTSPFNNEDNKKMNAAEKSRLCRAKTKSQTEERKKYLQKLKKNIECRKNELNELISSNNKLSKENLLLQNLLGNQTTILEFIKKYNFQSIKIKSSTTHHQFINSEPIVRTKPEFGNFQLCDNFITSQFDDFLYQPTADIIGSSNNLDFESLEFIFNMNEDDINDSDIDFTYFCEPENMMEH